jgi:hypothetical protein
MDEVGNEQHTTYGGEVEALTINRFTGSVAPLAQDLCAVIQKRVMDVPDLFASPVLVGYDSTASLVELRGGIYAGLAQLLHALQYSLVTLWQVLEEDSKQRLLASSYHPLDDPQSAYKYVVPRPIYSLMRGSSSDITHIHPDALPKIYPTWPELGRNWRHKETALAAAIQPWNSLQMGQAADQIAALQATGWIFNLLTANSPFAQGKWTGKRDYRLELWKAIMSTSRYKQDNALFNNVPTRPARLVDYYKYVFSNQRPAVIPKPQMLGNPPKDSKTNFLAIKQPDDHYAFNTLTYLQADRIKVIDLESAVEYVVAPSVAHVFNNFDFFYVPRYGARLRMNLPDAEQLDPKEFARAIIDGDEVAFQSLLVEGGIGKGSICVEGRVAATVLPTIDNPGWARFNIPFVLQTAIIRNYQEIFTLFEQASLTWHELTEILPAMTNNADYGFKTTLRGHNATALAKRVWKIARTALTAQERALVGDEIDLILDTQKAPAEEQIDLFKHEWEFLSSNTMHHLIDHLSVKSLPAPITETCNTSDTAVYALR